MPSFHHYFNEPSFDLALYEGNEKDKQSPTFMIFSPAF